VSTLATIYVPCDVVSVEAQLGYGDCVSPVERIVLEAVAVGETGIRQLNRVLGLDQRVLYDIVFDLWRAGHVHINHDEGEIRVSDDVRRLIDADRLDELDGAEVLRDRVELMIDRLLGRLRPAAGRTTRPSADWEVPLAGGGFGIEDIDHAERLRAIDDAFARRARQREGAGLGRPPRVRGVRLDPTRVRTGGQRWLRLEVASTVDEDRLVVAVVNHEWSAADRMAASDALRRLVAYAPEARIWKRLREAPDGALGDPPPPAEAIERLARNAAKAAAAPAGLRHARHRELCDDARSIEAQLANRVSGEITARVLDEDDAESAVVETLEAARRQIVLVSPRVAYDRVHRLLPVLRAALARDVQIVLLWGDRRDSSLPENVQNALRDLRRTAGAGAASPLLAPLTSVGTGGSLVVADDRTVLLPAGSVLGSGAGRGPAVLARGPGGRGSLAIRELLRHVRTMVPAYGMSRAVLVNESAFTDASSPPPPSTSPLVGVFPEPPSEDNDPAAEAVTRSWSRAWEAWAAKAADVLASRELPALQNVVDGAHRDLLGTAFREARRQVVVTSARVDPRAVDDNVVAAARECLGRGVPVTIVYGYPTHPDSVEPLRRLAEEFPGGLEVIQNTAQHGSLLVWDDEAVVGPFDFLSHDGQFRHGGRGGSRLGLRLSGGGFAARLGASAGVEIAAAPRSGATADGSVRDDYSTYIAAQAMVTSALSGGPEPALIIRELDAHERPWDVLEQLADTGAMDVIRIAAARCLAAHRASAVGDAPQRWLRWLVADRWRSGEFVEAAVLRWGEPDDSLRPRRPLALLAAARGNPALSDAALAEALDDDLLDAERHALVAVAAVDLLIGGSDTAYGVLELLGPDSAEPWAGLALRTLEYWGDALSVLPEGRILAEVGRRQSESAAEDSWRVLRQRLELAGNVHFNHTASRRAQQELFHEASGRLAGVRDATARQDPAALRDAIKRLPAADRLLEEACVNAARGSTPVEGRHRKVLGSRLAGVLGACRAVIRAAGTGDGSADAGSDGAVVVAARVFAAHMHASIGELRAAAAADVPEMVLARAALAELGVVVAWHPGAEGGRAA
jgi:hypothetical protein